MNTVEKLVAALLQSGHEEEDLMSMLKAAGMDAVIAARVVTRAKAQATIAEWLAKTWPAIQDEAYAIAGEIRQARKALDQAEARKKEFEDRHACILIVTDTGLSARPRGADAIEESAARTDDSAPRRAVYRFVYDKTGEVVFEGSLKNGCLSIGIDSVRKDGVYAYSEPQREAAKRLGYTIERV